MHGGYTGGYTGFYFWIKKKHTHTAVVGIFETRALEHHRQLRVATHTNSCATETICVCITLTHKASSPSTQVHVLEVSYIYLLADALSAGASLGHVQ